MKILIVDDNADDRKLLRLIIEAHGHQAVEASDGAEGLQKARQCLPDLVITDGLMPVMDGFQLLHTAKHDVALRSIPFIFYSSTYTDRREIDLAQSIGAEEYLIKPVEPTELWDKIMSVAAAHRADPSTCSPSPRPAEAFLQHYTTVVTRKLGLKVAQLKTLLREREKVEEELRIVATSFNAQVGIVITDANRRILRTNRVFTEITGYSLAEVQDKTPRVLRSGRQEEGFYRKLWEQIGQTGAWAGEIWNRRKTGEVYPQWLTISEVRAPEGKVSHYVGTLLDISAQKEAEQKIEHLAYYDSLTGLPNRRLLTDRIQQAMKGTCRTGGLGALLYIDLDNFKLINDTLGHDKGDELLVEVGQRLVSCVRSEDTVSRLGGDEFVVMLKDLGDSSRQVAARAKAVGEKILASLNKPYDLGGRIHYSTPSIGSTLFRGAHAEVEDLLKQADIAMYQAKASGRNTFRFFDPEMQAALSARADLEAELRKGVEESQFILYFQPQVAQGRGIIGAEALIRWKHPTRGMVSPDQFVPVAEETGLILPIGQWVLETACAQLKAWETSPVTRALDLAINVSALQFRQESFIEQVKQTLATSGAPATHLKLELTETLVLDNIEGTIAKMEALKELGVRFSMDDFGTGYSSLSYLTRLPLDQLKIDQSFVRLLPKDLSQAVVVQTIITLAQSLSLAVIAEGVETQEQWAFLEAHGCPVFQGYLASRPVPIADFQRLLPREASL